jgi:hypothetical protein
MSCHVKIKQTLDKFRNDKIPISSKSTGHKRSSASLTQVSKYRNINQAAKLNATKWKYKNETSRRRGLSGIAY